MVAASPHVVTEVNITMPSSLLSSWLKIQVYKERRLIDPNLSFNTECMPHGMASKLCLTHVYGIVVVERTFQGTAFHFDVRIDAFRPLPHLPRST